MGLEHLGSAFSFHFRVLDKLEKWEHNEVQQGQMQGVALRLGQSQVHMYRLGEELPDSSPAEKHLVKHSKFWT